MMGCQSKLLQRASSWDGTKVLHLCRLALWGKGYHVSKPPAIYLVVCTHEAWSHGQWTSLVACKGHRQQALLHAALQQWPFLRCRTFTHAVQQWSRIVQSLLACCLAACREHRWRVQLQAALQREQEQHTSDVRRWKDACEVKQASSQCSGPQ